MIERLVGHKLQACVSKANDAIPISNPPAVVLLSVMNRRVFLLIWLILAVEGVCAAALQYPWVVDDSRAYLSIARNLSGPGFGIGDGANFTPHGMRPPAYAWFLNIFHVRLGIPLAGIIALQIGAYLLTLWLIAYRLIEDRRHRLAFLLLAIVYFFPFFYVARILTEAWAGLLIAVLAVVLTRADERPGFWIIAGALVGVGGLLRSDILPVGLAIVALAFIKLKPRKAVQSSALAALFALILVSPFMAWNLSTFGRATPMPTTATIGQSLWLASWESKLSHDDMVTIYGGKPTPAAIESGYLKEYEATTARAQGRGEAALSSEFQKVALARIKADPFDAVLHIINGTWRLFTTKQYPVPWPWSLPLHVLSVGVLVFALWGASLNRLPWAPAIILLAVLIPHLPLHTEARYTAPVRPLMMFYASFGLWQLVSRLRWNRSRAGKSQQLSVK